MSERKPPAAATALTIPEQAQKALAFVETKAQLEALAAKSKRIVEIRDAAGYAECHGARMELKNKRIDIQRTGKTAREDATKFSKAVIAVEDELVGIIEAEEKRLQALQDVEDNKKAEAKRLLIEAEERRMRGHQQRIAAIREIPLGLIGMASREIGAALDKLFAEEYSPATWDEFENEARAVAGESMLQLRRMLVAQMETETAAQELAKQQAELALQQQQAAAARAEQERQDRERREAEEKAASERRAQADREAEERRQEQAKAEEVRQAAAREIAERDRREREAQEQAARVERDRIENEQREQRRQQEENERKAREESAAREREQLQRRGEELAEQARVLAAKTAAEEAKRIEDEAAGLQLLDVARDAHFLLIEEGLDQRNRALRLAAVLRRIDAAAPVVSTMQIDHADGDPNNNDLGNLFPVVAQGDEL